MNQKSLAHEFNEFPLLVKLDFSKLIDQLTNSKITKKLDVVERYYTDPKLEKLRNGLSSQAEILEFHDEICALMQNLFPHALRNNEIKAATIPFTNIIFHKSDRFEKILNIAGPGFELTTRNMDENNSYIFACCLILIYHYGYNIDFKRPFLYDIPNDQGKIRNYRIVLNGDFMEILPTDKTIPITPEDVAILIDNYDNVNVWKERFLPDSYVFKGFGIANMFDVTIDETLSKIKTNLIGRYDGVFLDLRDNIRVLFNDDTLDLGLTLYKDKDKMFRSIPNPDVKSILLQDLDSSHQDSALCGYLAHGLLVDKRVVTISDMDRYGTCTDKNQFYNNLQAQGYKSYMCAPLMHGDRILAVVELGSPKIHFLNSINANKLDDLIPILSTVVKKSEEDHKNRLEVIIQEQCTSIHPAVAWKFEEEAENFYRDMAVTNDATFNEIVFENVYPLYGQCDIRGSSDARNLGIKEDLLTQLSAAEKIIRKASKKNQLPIFNELIYRLEQSRSDLSEGLAAGIDQQVLDFLKTDVYPVFHHLQGEDEELALGIKKYMDMLDPDLKMVYKARRDYDETVMQINKHLASHLDLRAEEAQRMFPHFFERYKTDGIEYNIYIGQSLVKEKKFSSIYLHNIKLWQLTTMVELERQFNQIKPSLKTPLEVASLILAYSTSISIRFRMDEKQFDVDGAYNARYEIVKKRIDKAYIKGTTERLTQPGKISIVYSQQNERLEYDKYAQYLLALDYIKGDVEYHILEDLQGITGLRAMRYTVNYNESDKKQDRVTIKKKKGVIV